MYFKLKPKVGNHAHRDPEGKITVYHAADENVIESDIDLAKIFPHKFEKVDSNLSEDTSEPKKTEVEKAAEAGADGAADPTKKSSRKSRKEEEKKEANPLGEEVTSEFPKAVEEDFKVFSANGKGFMVVEPDEPTVPLHKELLPQEGVAPFIDKYLTE